MRKVCTVKVLQDYRLDLTFDDGVRGQVDLSDLVGRGGSLCGASITFLSRFGSVHSASLL